MKKMRKILAMLLALTMVLGMSVTSLAAIGGASITVNGLSTAGPQEVDIYEIYRLDDNNNLWVKRQWATAITQESDLADPEKLAELKDLVPETPDDTATSSNGTVSFDSLQAGAYLVLVKDTLNKTTYSPMVAVTYKYDSTTKLLVADSTTVVAKASTYNIEKTQSDIDDAVVEVGDLITYTIKTTVPYIKADETDISFQITDTLVGATYYLTGEAVKGVEAVSTVTVGGVAIEGVAIPSEAHEQSNFTLNLANLVSTSNTYAGKEIVITYTAKVSAVDTITNTANSDHVSNPEHNATTAYTGQATITKYNEDKSKELSGATFVLYRMNGANKEYAKLDDNKYVTGEWTTDLEQAGTVTTNESGVATIKGLNVGTYYFKETIAPDGYSINTTDSPVTVTKTENDATVTVSGNTEMTDTQLIALPSTGGIGTTIFTVAGCGIMIAAAFFFFASRKRENE